MVGIMFKRCNKCGEMKLIGDFYKDKKNSDGRNFWCKECVRKHQAKHYRKNAERIRAVSAKYRKENPEKAKSCVKKWRKRNRFRFALTQSRHAAKRLGYEPCLVPPEELEEAFTGVCDFCGMSEAENGKRLGVDHDHATGAFRGFLCIACNNRDVLGD